MNYKQGGFWENKLMFETWALTWVMVFLLGSNPHAAELDKIFRQLQELNFSDNISSRVEIVRKGDWQVTSFTGALVNEANLRGISEFTNLESLFFRGDGQATQEGWQSLKGLVKLKQLWLTKNFASNAKNERWGDIGVFRGIRDISLSFTSSDFVLTSLAGNNLERIFYFDASGGYNPNPEETGASLAKLRGFPELKSLNLPFQGVGNAQLDHIIMLKKLENLNLLRSSVTEAGVLRLAGLPNLVSLSLNLVDQQGLDALGNLPRLEHLEIRESKAEELDFSRLIGVKSLTLGMNEYSVPWCRPIRWPPNLQSLCMTAWVKKDERKGTKVLQHFPPDSLKKLRLRLSQGWTNSCITPKEFKSRKPSELSWLEALPNLSDLELVDPIAKDFDSILSLVRLRRLVISRNRRALKSEQISKLNTFQQLESLNIHVYDLEADTALDAIAEIKSLRELETSFMAIKIGKICNLANLEKLSLSLNTNAARTGVNNRLAGIGALSKLEELNLGGTITNNELRALAGLKKLQRLDLQGCQGFTDTELVDLIGKLGNLETISFGFPRQVLPLTKNETDFSRP